MEEGRAIDELGVVVVVEMETMGVFEVVAVVKVEVIFDVDGIVIVDSDPASEIPRWDRTYRKYSLGNRQCQS